MTLLGKNPLNICIFEGANQVDATTMKVRICVMVNTIHQSAMGTFEIGYLYTLYIGVGIHITYETGKFQKCLGALFFPVLCIA